MDDAAGGYGPVTWYGRLASRLCVCAVLAGGCGRDAADTSPPAPDQMQPASCDRRVLLPVALPDLSPIEEPVQLQLRERHELLMQKRQTAGTPAAELSAAFGEMGKLLMAAKQFSLAAPYLLNAYTCAPRDRRWSYYLGHLYMAKGTLAQAAAFFEKALDEAPRDVATLVWLGEVHLAEDRPTVAAPLFARALEAQPRSQAARFGLGRAALAEHDYRAAVEHLEAALALDARAVSIHYPLALAYRGLGDAVNAEMHLRRRGVYEILPADPLMDELRGLLRSAIAYEIRGSRALNNGDWRTAIAEFREGLALEPSNPALRHKLGTALYMSGNLHEAREAFEQVVRTSPEYARAHYSLGVLLESEGRYQQAMQRFSAALAREPDYVEARVRLAELLQRSGRLKEALTEFEHVLTIDPRLSDALFGHAMTLVRLRRYQAAGDELREAVRRRPDEPLLAHALARLLAAAPDDRVRDGREALAVMQALSEQERRLDLGESMAMTLAELRQYNEAAAWQRGAIAAARQAGNTALAERMAASLRLYEAGRPARTPWRDEEMP